MAKLPPRAYILERYDYNPETGEVINKKRKKPISGKKARYQRIKLLRQMFQLHRVIWYMQTGQDPAVDGLVIDHINGDGNDNRWSNLRACTQQQNNAARRCLGFCKVGKLTWQAQVKVDGKNIHLGRFPCPLLARLAYVDKKLEVFGEFAGV